MLSNPAIKNVGWVSMVIIEKNMFVIVSKSVEKQRQFVNKWLRYHEDESKHCLSLPYYEQADKLLLPLSWSKFYIVFYMAISSLYLSTDSQNKLILKQT